MVEGRGGKERCSFRTRTGANIFVWWKGGVENVGLGRCNCMLLDQRHIARTRTGANSIAWWKDGVGKNCVLFAHVPEPSCVYGGRNEGRERKSTVKNENQIGNSATGKSVYDIK
jgi:hypothetical protein